MVSNAEVAAQMVEASSTRVVASTLPTHTAASSQQISQASHIETWEICIDSSERDGDGFDFGVVVEDFFAHFAAPTGLLVSAERQRGVEDVVAVDPHGAGAQAARHLVGKAEVLRPHGGGQPEDSVVGAL